MLLQGTSCGHSNVQNPKGNQEEASRGTKGKEKLVGEEVKGRPRF